MCRLQKEAKMKSRKEKKKKMSSIATQVKFALLSFLFVIYYYLFSICKI